MPLFSIILYSMPLHQLLRNYILSCCYNTVLEVSADHITSLFSSLVIMIVTIHLQAKKTKRSHIYVTFCRVEQNIHKTENTSRLYLETQPTL